MAQKRMFDKTITNSDNFLEMPDSTQNLYFHLSMEADDDGFVDNWKSIMRMTGKKEDDLKILIAKQYIIPFDSGIIVIRHWRINNYLRKDRYHQTKYLNEKSQLKVEKNEEYTLQDNVGIPVGNREENRIEENSIDKNITTTTNIDIYKYIEDNFGRFISPIEKEKLDSWLLLFPEDVLKYAIELSVLQNKKTFSYFEGILNNWKSSGYKTLQEIKDNDIKPNKTGTTVPKWFDKKIESEEASKQEQQEMANILNEF